MADSVAISFDCLPLRSIPRMDLPLDAPPEYEALYRRIKAAAAKHGLHNTYYLYNGSCVYHLTNRSEVGSLEFKFEGTVLTAPDDASTQSADLNVELVRETCDWLTHPIVEWFAETVQRAVIVEFDRFIASGDLQRTRERLERLASEIDARQAFLGHGL